MPRRKPIKVGRSKVDDAKKHLDEERILKAHRRIRVAVGGVDPALK
jgi:hypothetical protein